MRKKNHTQEISNKSFNPLIKGTVFKERFQKMAQLAVDDLYEHSPLDADFKVRIEPIAPQKHLFAVSIQATVDGRQTVVIKKGRRIFNLINRCKRSVLKLLRRKKSEKIKLLHRRTPAYRLRPSDLEAS